MCVAILQMPGKRVSLEKLDEGARCNGDGAGYSWVDGQGVIRVRRSLDWKNLRRQFQHDVEVYGADSPFLIHFRIKSHGLVNKDNCHPFVMSDGGAFIHNGIIKIPNIPEGESDTRWFVEHIINGLPRRWERDIVWCTMVETMIGNGSKAVGLWPDKAFFIFNESSGHWEDDKGDTVAMADGKEKGTAWFSNHSCNLPVQKWSPNPKVETKALVTHNTGTGGGAGATNERLPFEPPRQFPLLGQHASNPGGPPRYGSRSNESSGNTGDSNITPIIRRYTHNGIDLNDYSMRSYGYEYTPGAGDATREPAPVSRTELIHSTEVLRRIADEKTPEEVHFDTRMLLQGMCPECATDCGTQVKAEDHLLFHCTMFREKRREMGIKIHKEQEAAHRAL